MINQVFQIDQKFWNQQQLDIVAQFFLSNQFFSKFYQKKYFHQIVKITFYQKIQNNSSVLIQNNKKPYAIILLSGKINILIKKKQEKHHKKQKNHKIYQYIQNQKYFYENFKIVTKQNQPVIVGSQCKIISLNESEAQILFVPCNLYQHFQSKLLNENIENLFKDLQIFFPKIEKKILKNLAKAGCYYKQCRFNDFVYKIGDQPNEIYLLIDGRLKLQKLSSKNIVNSQSIILYPQAIFGQKDIKLNNRTRNAITYSSYIKLLAIPKNQFLKFYRQNLPQIQFQEPDNQSFHLPNLKNRANSFNLKQNNNYDANKFHSIQSIKNDKLIESKLIRNCHILLNYSPKRSKTLKLDKTNQQIQDYTKDQFQLKLKLFHKRRPNLSEFNLQNPIFQSSTPKNYTIKMNNMKLQLKQ